MAVIDWIRNILAIYGLILIILKIFFRKKTDNASVPDIIDGNLSVQEICKRNETRNKWYYKFRKWF